MVHNSRSARLAPGLLFKNLKQVICVGTRVSCGERNNGEYPNSQLIIELVWFYSPSKSKDFK